VALHGTDQEGWRGFLGLFQTPSLWPLRRGRWLGRKTSLSGNRLNVALVWVRRVTVCHRRLWTLFSGIRSSENASKGGTLLFPGHITTCLSDRRYQVNRGGPKKEPRPRGDVIQKRTVRGRSVIGILLWSRRIAWLRGNSIACRQDAQHPQGRRKPITYAFQGAVGIYALSQWYRRRIGVCEVNGTQCRTKNDPRNPGGR